MHIVVIGAGIIGLTTAWFLVRDGHAVTIIDRETGVGLGTSFANGAQLSYSYVAPMASPDVLASLPKYLFSRDSPVRYVPSFDPDQWLWLARFLGACTGATSAANTARLLALASDSRTRLHDLARQTGIDFAHKCNGKLVVQSSLASQRAAEAQMLLQANMGSVQQALTAAECIALEPGLQSIAARLVGGIHTPSEEVGDCWKLCIGLEDSLRATRVTFLLGQQARLAMQSGAMPPGRVAGVDLPTGRVTADLYVLAAGTGSPALGAQAHVSVPVQPIRGYSISAPIIASNRAPVRSITDTARKAVYAPLGDRLRVAGFAEISGAAQLPATRLPDRAAALLRELQAIFPGACGEHDLRPWSGSRPATPTGVPCIGPCRVPNLLLNLGHGALGFTLAAGSAGLLADLVAGRPPRVTASDYA
jgi:D-amino-acid dehydrogenase